MSDPTPKPPRIPLPKPPRNALPSIYRILVICDSEAEQRSIYERLKAEGRACRVLTG